MPTPFVEIPHFYPNTHRAGQMAQISAIYSACVSNPQLKVLLIGEGADYSLHQLALEQRMLNDLHYITPQASWAVDRRWKSSWLSESESYHWNQPAHERYRANHGEPSSLILALTSRL